MIPTLSAWGRSASFARFVADVLGDAIARLRPGRPSAPDFQALDLDSLERFQLAVALAEALQLPRIERLHECAALPQWIDEARRCLPMSAGGVGFRTSGSTGERKFVAHPFAALAQEIVSLATLFAGRRRIVALVPSHHIYGFLFTALLPLRLDVEAIDGRTACPTFEPGDLIVAVPSLWRLYADRDWPGEVQGVSSGAPCSAEVGAALRRGGLRLVEIYGSTETAGVGWREETEAPFRLLPHWRRDGDDGLRKQVEGAERRYELPDRVEWRGEDRLIPLARRDGAVQIGGVNVYPEAVRNALRTHPGVADAAVRLMRPDEGERLKAFVIAKDARAATQELHRELEVWSTQNLQPMERPRAFTFGASLPVNDLGKAADWDIAPPGAP